MTAAAVTAVPLLGAPAASAASPDDWQRLAMCESGGNWSINTGNGYYGGLQFSSSTWLAYGGGGYAPRADLATPTQQMDIANRVLASQGWNAWPTCSRKVGLYGTSTSPPPPPPAAPLVVGAILQRYTALGGSRSFLGAPLTPELATPIRYGRYNHFQGGSIYWSPATGAWESHGAIRDRWAALGWENSSLGFPVTDENRTPNRFGAFNHFEGGSVYWSPATGAHQVGGAIRDAWAARGWENSRLGFPTSDEYAVPGGRRSTFQGGSITWTPAGGAVVRLG